CLIEFNWELEGISSSSLVERDPNIIKLVGYQLKLKGSSSISDCKRDLVFVAASEGISTVAVAKGISALELN
ncbi:hypothetical protein TorRG33x02_280820, partial [Trema orientale]